MRFFHALLIIYFSIMVECQAGQAENILDACFLNL